MELEEELAQLRPPPAPSPQPPENKPEEEELVVYGPINKEPEEKLYPWKYGRRDSGVRKFFKTLWTRNSDRDNESSNRSTSQKLNVKSASIDQTSRTPSSASSSRTPATPVVHYHRVTQSPSPQRSSRRHRESDSVLSISYSSHTSSKALSFSSLLRDDESNASQDFSFDGAFMAQEFGDSTR